MPTAAEALDEIRGAIEQLRAAAADEGDKARGQTADWLDGQFDDVHGPSELRAAAKEALRLYRGGMGSFRDTGTATMDAAVDRLGHALTRVV